MGLGLVLGLCGCKNGAFDWSFLFRPQSKTAIDSRQYVDPLAQSAAYRDTVAQYAYLDGLRRLRVRTYGIVAGLGRNGSKQCPTAIRGQLIQEMYKTRKFAQRRGQHVSPERLVDDPDTAVVAVEGEIPAAAPAGTRFDLIVRAFPGTQTTSLQGGWLYPCEVKLFRSKGPAGWIAGRAMGRGAGPIFLNPFGQGGTAATKTNLREGVIIGGGVSKEDRRIRVILTEPSYPRAISIVERINERFGISTNMVADAISPAEVRLVVPDAYRHNPKHFLSVVQHLYLPANRPGFLSDRSRELVREFATPDAPHVEIALAWEGIGRNILPDVQSFYSDPRPACSFYSAVAGLHLGDDDAVRILAEHLNNPKSPYRMAAIGVLGSARYSRRASRPLRRALNDDDPRYQIAAYEALLHRDDPTIRSYQVADGAFSVDVVSGGSRNLIYAKRSGAARIVLFGDDITAQPPLFFALPDDSLIIDAEQGARRVTLVRKTPFSGVTSPRIECGVGIRELLMLVGGNPPRSQEEPIQGLGVDYGSIVLALSELCKSRAINADFVLEAPGMAMTPSAPSAFVRPES
ncbi:MAG: flagellar basal body P-ring protein FlgI [Phycisphaerae bacterium]